MRFTFSSRRLTVSHYPSLRFASLQRCDPLTTSCLPFQEVAQGTSTTTATSPAPSPATNDGASESPAITTTTTTTTTATTCAPENEENVDPNASTNVVSMNSTTIEEPPPSETDRLLEECLFTFCEPETLEVCNGGNFPVGVGSLTVCVAQDVKCPMCKGVHRCERSSSLHSLPCYALLSFNRFCGSMMKKGNLISYTTEYASCSYSFPSPCSTPACLAPCITKFYALQL